MNVGQLKRKLEGMDDDYQIVVPTPSVAADGTEVLLLSLVVPVQLDMSAVGDPDLLIMMPSTEVTHAVETEPMMKRLRTALDQDAHRAEA